MLEACRDHRTRQITVVASAQSGKTANAILNVLGHRYMDGPRVPALLVVPTQKLAKSMSTDRLKRLIDTTPGLNSIHAKGKRDSIYEKWIGGVPLRLGWAGSATELASHPAGLALVDELDRMTADVAGEGDPLTLVRARTITYPNRLIVVCSTPTIEDASAIQAEFDGGSMEMGEWPCPHCGDHHRPLSMHLRWEKGADPDRAAATCRYVCPSCGAECGDIDKARMLAGHRFARYQRNADGGYVRRPDDQQELEDYTHRSFWVSGLLAPWNSFSQLARELCNAYRSQEPAKIQAVLNTYFGELWAVRGHRPPLEDIMRCREDYPIGVATVDGVQRVTMGVDVQQDRLVWVRCGFGAEAAPMECWVLEYGEIYGNPTFDDVWIELRRFHVDVQLKVSMCLIDSGWKPGITFARSDHRIYSFCRRSGEMAFPSKGYRRRPEPVSSHLHDVEEHGRKIKNGVRLYLVDVTFFKTMIYSRMAPDQEEHQRAFHLPMDASEEFMRQATAEEMVPKASGEPYYHCPRGRANHYLDALVNACAANYTLDMRSRLRPLKRARPQLDVEPVAHDQRARVPERFTRRSLV